MAARQVARVAQPPPWLRAAASTGAASPMLAVLLRPSGTTTAARLGPGLAQRGFQTLASPLLAKKREYANYDRNRRRGSAHQDRGVLQTSSNSISILLPDTMVKPPVWRYPRSPVKFAKMAWFCAKHSFMSFMTLAFYKISSKETFMSKAKFNIKRGALVPTAKALHLEMNDALARGDREHLRRICTNEFYAKLASIIDARPRGYRAEWDLVKYTHPVAYPRLAEHKIGVLPTSGGQRAIRQAIVSIASVQKVTRFGPAGDVTAEQTKDMFEHLVLTCDIEERTYESTPWRIWGTLPETTLEAYLDASAAEDWVMKNPNPRANR